MKAGLSFLLLTVFLISCAPPIRDPFGTALRQGRVPSSVAPESLSADLGITPRQKGLSPFAARLYARPYHQYRVDAMGLVSTVASYVWAGDHWTLLLNEKREVWTGAGDTLDVEGLPLRLPGVNAVLGFLWGDPLPGFRNRDADTLAWSGDTLQWKVHGTRWQAIFDPVSGACLEARSSELALRYSGQRRYGSHVLPGEVEVFADGKSLLLMDINKVEEHPGWKKNPFELSVPASYERRSPEFPPDDGGGR